MFQSSLSQTLATVTGANDSRINAIVMGRKTWESIPEEKRPLPNRLNVILTRNGEYQPTYGLARDGTPEPLVCSSLGSALDTVNQMEAISEVFVIGGQAIFEEALSDEMSHMCKLIIGTRINREYESDVFMPPFEERFEPLFIS